MNRGTLFACGALSIALCAACDETDAWHTPHATLARMQEQARIDPFDPAMAEPPPFTVARGAGPNRARPPMTRDLVERGRTRFEVFCGACHGVLGDGQSVVATKMLARKPRSLLEDEVRALPDERIEAIIEQGYGMMPSYADRLEWSDRWAVVSYVRALQIAQGVNADTLPMAMRAELAKVAP